MIIGEKVALRPIEQKDLSFLADLTNHTGVASNVVGWDKPVSNFGQETWLQNLQSDQKSIRLMVVGRESGKPLGMTGLWEMNWQNRDALSATKLHPDFVAKGHGVDAIMTTMAWAFYSVGLRRLHSSILDFNYPSFSVYVKKCGWRVEGVAKEAVFRKGEWCDLLQVAVLRSDFDELGASAEYVERFFPTNVKTKFDYSGR